jgi:nitroreductase
MDVLTALTTRTSAARLGDEKPSREQIQQILDAGMHAPDHGQLVPWRFVVLEGQGIDRLGNAMADAMRRNNPAATDDELDRLRRKAHRAPLIIVVAARSVAGRIPEIEQIVATGACVQNMFLAAFALGLGAMWKTGDAAYDDGIKVALGLEASDTIVAYLYLGVPLLMKPMRELSAEPVTTWIS